MKIDVMPELYVRSIHDALSIDTSIMRGGTYTEKKPHTNIITLPKMPEPKLCWLDERRRGTLPRSQPWRLP